MGRLAAILLLVLAIGCNKEDDPEKFTSINGHWTLSTPDGLTRVSFSISQDSDNINVIDRISVVHNATDFNSKPIDAGIITISGREIESITFTNNSFEPPYFVIRLLNISVNEDYTQMQIANSSFNINGEFREFSMINATR